MPSPRLIDFRQAHGYLAAPSSTQPAGRPLGANELWDRIIEHARTGVTEHTYNAWFSTAKPLSWSEGILRVEVPTQFNAEWLEDKYGSLLQDLGTRIAGTPIALQVAVKGVSPGRQPPEVTLESVSPPPSPDASRQASSPAAPPAPTPSLNARYTFDHFVVGENNRLAQAASIAVAEQPGQSYNPLFLHGPTGLGKTHLMQAIAHRILDSGSGPARICYIPAEQFMNEMVAAIQLNRTDAFRARYRSYELLLVDDVQFLRKKEHTQEEFFHTFNALYNGGRQIVLTSDRRPKDLEGLEERLVSRFEWGLVTDVSAPDYETRVAILRKKAQQDHVELDPAIIDLVARCYRSSVRELEGAVLKLLAFGSLTRQEITLEMARATLAGYGDGPTANGDGPTDGLESPEAVRDWVAAQYGLSGATLASKGRSREISLARQVAMYLIKEVLEVPLARIGKAFGGRDHSTVLYSVRQVKRRMDAEHGFRQRLEAMEQKLRRSA